MHDKLTMTLTCTVHILVDSSYLEEDLCLDQAAGQQGGAERQEEEQAQAARVLHHLRLRLRQCARCFTCLREWVEVGVVVPSGLAGGALYIGRRRHGG